jgi:hypothetical protein
MQQLDHPGFPVVACLEGGITEDGQAILVQMMLTVGGGPVQFALRLADLEKFLTFFLRMSASFGRGAPAEDRVQYQPIPISGMSAGELADGTGCVGVAVGGTELMFQMPLAQLSEFAQTLLMVGVPGDRHRMS